MYPPELYPGPTIQSRSAARRAAQDLVTIMMKMVMMMVMINKFVLFIRGQLSFHASHKAKYSLIVHFDQ